MSNSRLASRRLASRRALAGLSAAAVAGSLLTGLGPAPDPEPAQARPCEDCEVTPTTRRTTTTTKPAGTPPSASFGWTRGKRAGGANASSDLNALTSYINSAYLVHLNGCGSKAGANPVASHQWSVNGQALSGCAPTWATNQQGTFTATLTVTDTAGLKSTTSQTITVKDRLIVTLGDSIASGEGNPAVAQQYDWAGFVKAGPQWPNRRCHRTPNAATQQAMTQYENSHPQESVTFVNLSCSGAKAINVLQARYGGQHYAGIEPDGYNEAPQLDQLEQLKARTGRQPDMVYMSAGANDFGFAAIAKACAEKSSWTSSTPQCAQLDPQVKAGSDLLVGWRNNPYSDPVSNYGSGRFAALAGGFTQAGIPNDRVVVSHYPDPTKKDNGDWCDNIMADTPLGLGRINRVDVIWAGGTVNVLNDAVSYAAQQNGWKLVPGIWADYQTHGYCASGKWVVNYSESNHTQGNIDGTLHPNAAGTNQYAVRIKEAAVNNGFIRP